MASNDLLPNTQAMVEPKAKKKYKTKKEKEKDITMEHLVIVAQTMVGGEFHDEEAHS
jgi:hypothetical protein